MQTYRFTVNGLRHHDFAERLDELCRLAPGRRLTLCVEPDNPGEADAVIAYLGSRCVGYVRSGQRAEACALIRASRQEVLQGRVVGTDRQRRWLTVEMTAARLTLPSQPEAGRSHLLSRWSFEGRTLPVDEAERRLHAMLASLQIVLESCEPWEDDVEEWLEYIERQLWRDISSETSAQVAHILRLLTDGTPRHPLYADKALRLQLAIERMGSPEVRRRQAQHIVELARSAHMDELLCHYGQRAGEAVLSLPAELKRLFQDDGELLMGRLWYLRLPRHQVRALRTLLAMTVRLHDDERPAPSFSSAASADAASCRFIHPALDDDAACQVHREVLRLCRHFGLQDICTHLTLLASNGRLLLPQNARTAYDELSRLGMPADSPGFDYKTFMKYYRK